MNELVIPSCIAEISDCMKRHCLFIENELKLGTTPGRYEILNLLCEAVDEALDILKTVPDFMRRNKKYSDEHVSPLIRDTYAIMEDFGGEDADVVLPKLLIMCGFMAISLSRSDTGCRIFEALKKYRPQSEYPLIGIAYAYLSKGAYEPAISTLRDEALKINPQSDLARAFLALSYTCLKKHEEMKQLTGMIIDNDEDQNAIAIARALLDEYHSLHGERALV